MGAILGIVAGLVAAAPLVAVLRMHVPRLVVGLAAIMTSFLVFHLVAVLVHELARADLISFATTSTLTFLAIVVTIALRHDG